MSKASEDQERLGQVENAINTYSRPSELKITDMRLAVVCSNYDYPIIRIDTNQGVYGIGEVRDAGHLALLEEHLEEAEVRPASEIGPDVVTMNSEVRVTDLATGEPMQFRLVYPRVAATASGTVSVLAPLGMAVLGRRTGEGITWEAPGGTRRIRVDEVLYQPERDGADSGHALGDDALAGRELGQLVLRHARGIVGAGHMPGSYCSDRLPTRARAGGRGRGLRAGAPREAAAGVRPSPARRAPQG